MLKLLIFIISYGNKFYFINASSCLINMKKIYPEAVILSSDNYEFLYPPPNETRIFVRRNETILISCPGGKLSIGGSLTAKATCLKKNIFAVSDKRVKLSETLCTKQPAFTALDTRRKCHSSSHKIKVGFLLEDGHFVNLYVICFNTDMQIGLYAHYKLTASISKRIWYPTKLNFIQGSFYDFEDGIAARTLYSIKSQQLIINRLVGLPDNSTKYVKNDRTRCFQRGHLAPRGDFVYRFQQMATYLYVNCAPQWAKFNSDNWNDIEGDIRKYAENSNYDLDIYSGVYGISTLPHAKTKRKIQLYLYINEETGHQSVPVPDIFWKIVYNQKTKEGVAFIIHNNPYDKYMHKYCNDVSKQIRWLTKCKNPFMSGSFYACTVKQLKKIIEYIPRLDVKFLMK